MVFRFGVGVVGEVATFIAIVLKNCLNDLGNPSFFLLFFSFSLTNSMEKYNI